MSTLTQLTMDVEDAEESGVDTISIEVEGAKRIVEEFDQLTTRNAELEAEVARYKSANTDLVKTLDVIGGLSMARRVGGPDPMDMNELDRAVEIAIDLAHEAIARNALKESGL